MRVHDVGGVGGIVLDGTHAASNRVLYGIGSERQTDDRYGRTDNDSRHELVDPGNTGDLDNDCNHDIHERSEQCANDQSEITNLYRCRTTECREHGADECERGAKEDRTLELREQQIHDRTDTCAEQSGRRGHTVAHDSRNRDGCR